jgi:type VI secretion system protein
MQHRKTTGDQSRSVAEHLKKLLNSRQGTTLMDIDYGMPDFTDLRASYPDSVQDIEQTIKNTIMRYEPRVKKVDVHFMFQDEQNLTLFFEISAVLESEQKHFSIFLESTLDAGGKMAVRG